MTWPMLPGESLTGLAAKFYPSNKVMQGLFVAKTMRLNAEALPKLNAAAGFKEPTAVFIPTLKSLSSRAQTIKKSQQKANKHNLQLSYNIQAAVENLPKKLLNEYENLVTRNTFLKDELAKLNVKLVFLQNKLNDLKLILDKTLSLPRKKIFKNLDAKPTNKIEIKNNTTMASAPVETASTFSQIGNFILDPESRNIWMTLAALGIIGALIGYLLKKYREKMFNKLAELAQEKGAISSSTNAWQDTQLEFKDAAAPTPLGADTMVGEQSTSAILDEAKTMVAKGEPLDAIEHLKWAIRAKPKKAINLWLYMLQIFREQNLKDDFENYAKAMHQTFNVMTPLWEEKALPMFVPQSLEEFKHIIEKLTAAWPSKDTAVYLRNLITDNRDGERAGFGKEVLHEILLLIEVLESR